MTTPMLQVSGLHVRYGDVHAVNGVDLTVGRGEVLGIVGESGCGKSSVARAIVGLLPPVARITDGSALLDGHEVLARSEKDLQDLRRRRIAFMPQHSSAALFPLHQVRRQFADAIRLSTGARRRPGRVEVDQVAGDLLSAVGIRDVGRVLDMYPHQLSGGMAQRVALCVVLARGPELLIADEPTSGLDLSVLRQVMDLVARRCSDMSMTAVLVTHNIGVVAQYCTEVAVMYGGTIVESGTVEQVLADPLHPYTRGLLGALPQRGKPLALMPGSAAVLRAPLTTCAFWHRCPVRSGSRCETERPLLIDRGDGHRVASFCATSEMAEQVRTDMVLGVYA
jgi:peptide/nickel transport system ATP-binding protein